MNVDSKKKSWGDFSNHVTSVLKVLRDLKDKSLSMQELIKREIDPIYPQRHDYNGSVKAMVVMHNTYSFNVESASNGDFVYVDHLNNSNVRILEAKENIGPVDWLEFAKRAIKFKYYDSAIDFVKEGLSKSQKGSKLNQNLKRLAKKLSQLNNKTLLRDKTVVGSDYVIKPYLVTEELDVDPTDVKLKGLEPTLKMVKDAVFRKTCSEGSFQYKSKKMERCKWVHHNDPYLKLGPFKADVQRSVPYLVVFRDILNEAEIQWLIEYSTPKLSRTRYREDFDSEKEKKGYTKIIHKTVQTWIQEQIFKPKIDEKRPEVDAIVYPTVHSIAKRIQLATQLHTALETSVTKFQVTNYGLGGLCEVHSDPYGYIEGHKLTPHYQFLRETGDMFGTFMAWLNDVEAGGATAFTRVYKELAIMPERGSAAFWHSLDRKGHRDYMADHGGCPIIKGTKWILNKWMFFFDNFQKFPCGLNVGDKFDASPGSHSNHFAPS